MAKILATRLLRRPLDVLLVERNLLDQATVAAILEQAQKEGLPLDELLLRECPDLDEKAFYPVLAEANGLPYSDLPAFEPPAGLPSTIPALLMRYGALPTAFVDGVLTVAFSRPSLMAELEQQVAGAGLSVRFVVARPVRITECRAIVAPAAAAPALSVPPAATVSRVGKPPLAGGTVSLGVSPDNSSAMRDPAKPVAAFRQVLTQRGASGEESAEEEDTTSEEASLLADLASSLGQQRPVEERQTKVIDISDTADQPPVVKLVNQMLSLAVKQRVSDIHIESLENGARVRFRIDGVLVTRLELQRNAASAFISRVMVMAGLDITERVLPQDGSFKVRHEGNDVEFRIASVPGTYDQYLTLRMLLGSKGQALGLESVGFNGEERAVIEKQIMEPHGMILVSGPTGSGKSTTLYAILEAMAGPGDKLITIEDPIERHLENVQQIQVRINRKDPERSLTFARGLRSILRLDPDVIMVGEIRDKETADIGIQASMTGHLVLSSVHANSSVETLRRMFNMGVDAYLMVSSLNLVVAQRLVRRLCSACRVAQAPTAAEARLLPGETPATIFHAQGCPRCNAGYQGRVALFEFLVLEESLRDQFEDGRVSEFIARARAARRRSLLDCGLARIAAGDTDFSELERVCGPCR